MTPEEIVLLVKCLGWEISRPNGCLYNSQDFHDGALATQNGRVFWKYSEESGWSDVSSHLFLMEVLGAAEQRHDQEVDSCH